MKSKARILSESIQAKTGQSLVVINYWAFEYVKSGLCSTRLEALEYMEGL